MFSLEYRIDFSAIHHLYSIITIESPHVLQSGPLFYVSRMYFFTYFIFLLSYFTYNTIRVAFLTLLQYTLFTQMTNNS